ncbi:MAG: hypothetical protein GZ094_04085 [Mariniphaga sp.]|nr:hypothetical protein [Mariniphaga sp.]
MKWNYVSLLIISILLSCHIRSQAQLSGNNLAEFQYGQLPNDTSSISTIYDRLVLNYNYKWLKANATIEQFYSPIGKSSYVNLSQFSAHLRFKPFEFKVGNFYETIGRGLLLRSFEIPGAILEDLSYRSRHYFNRDILGVSARYNYKNFNTKLIYGRPLNYVFPPTQAFKNRRPDEFAAVYSEYSFKQQTMGLAAMQHSNGGVGKTFLMATASGNISHILSYYTELAKNVSDFGLGDFSNIASYAFYNGLNFTKNNFGISAEYKNYKNFLIGSGINEPPALVKEHSYKVLNRSTHVLQLLNETGYQAELFYTFPDLSILTFNNTLAINNFGQKFVFQEFFLEYDFSISEKDDIKIFTDYAKDPFKLENHRVSAGISTDWKVLKNSAIQTDYEFQSFERMGEYYQNHVFVLGYAYKSKFICNITSEYSNDSFFVSEGSKIWLGANLKYQLNNNHSCQIFAGERRGGPACNAGVCYEVLDFTGIEMRLTSRL